MMVGCESVSEMHHRFSRSLSSSSDGVSGTIAACASRMMANVLLEHSHVGTGLQCIESNWIPCLCVCVCVCVCSIDWL